MENEEAKRDFFANQNMIVTICFTISVGGISFIIGLLNGKHLSYLLIPIGLALLSWVFSVFSGLIFLIKRGNNSGQALSGGEVPVHDDYHNAPKYLIGQVILGCLGIAFLLIWLVWHLISNSTSNI